MKKMQGVALGVTVALLSGCQGAMELGGALSKTLGVPVEVVAKDSDECAKQQLNSWTASYNALSATDRAQFVEKFHARYSKVLVNPTANTETVAQDTSILEYVSCDTSDLEVGDYEVLEGKQVLSHRKVDGAAPATDLEKGNALTITAESSTETVQTTTYATQAQGEYLAIRSSSDPLFQDDLRTGVIQDITDMDPTRTSQKVSCGVLASLGELL